MSALAAAPRRAGALPLVAIAVLAGVALWPWLRWAVEAPPTPAAAAATSALALPALPTLDALGETAERPLFAPTRRPAAAPRTATVALGFRLEGVMAIGTERRAIIKRSDGTTARVGEGEVLGEWTVRRVERDRVVLGAGDRTLELVAGRSLTPPAAPR